MKILLFLLLPFLAQAQKLTFLEGAGISPVHIESLGIESGWVEVWIGPMAQNGQIFYIDIGYWDQIESIDIVQITWVDTKKARVFSRKEDSHKRTVASLGAISSFGGKRGTWIRWEYKVNFKRT